MTPTTTSTDTWTQARLKPPAAPLPAADLGAETLRSMHRAMVLTRALDTKMVLMQRQGRIHFYGPITGQEASTLGSAFALRPQDWLFPALREAAAAMARGLPISKMISQCFGNSLDTTRGRQMPCHYVDRAGHYYAMSSAIGTQIPHAVGAAYAMKVRKEDAIAVAYMGDGATSEGDFHAAMNMAGVWKVPCVFVCQNNQWSITVPYKLQTATATIAEKAVAYGFPGIRCDGNDILDVYETVRIAAERARTGGGPTLVECNTYRVLGHTTSDDPTRYRDEREVEPWRKRDPIDLFEKAMRERGILSGGEPAEAATWARELVDATIAEVEHAPPPPPASIIEDVTKDVNPRLREQLTDAMRTWKPAKPGAAGH